MSAKNHGTLPSTGIRSNVYEATDSGNTVTVTIISDISNVASNTPAIGTAHPSSSAYSLKRATQEAIGADLWKITLQYIAVAASLPEATASEQTSYVEVPIQEHPDFASWSADWDEENERFISSSDKVGITSYIKGSTTVTKTTYYSSKPSPVYEDIGKLEAPGGDYTGATNWLVIGATRQKVGNYWMIEKTYLYSAKAYNEDVYPD